MGMVLMVRVCVCVSVAQSRDDAIEAEDAGRRWKGGRDDVQTRQSPPLRGCLGGGGGKEEGRNRTTRQRRELRDEMPNKISSEKNKKKTKLGSRKDVSYDGGNNRWIVSFYLYGAVVGALRVPHPRFIHRLIDLLHQLNHLCRETTPRRAMGSKQKESIRLFFFCFWGGGVPRMCPRVTPRFYCLSHVRPRRLISN